MAISCNWVSVVVVVVVCMCVCLCGIWASDWPQLTRNSQKFFLLSSLSFFPFVFVHFFFFVMTHIHIAPGWVQILRSSWNIFSLCGHVFTSVHAAPGCIFAPTRVFPLTLYAIVLPPKFASRSVWTHGNAGPLVCPHRCWFLTNLHLPQPRLNTPTLRPLGPWSGVVTLNLGKEMSLLDSRIFIWANWRNLLRNKRETTFEIKIFPYSLVLNERWFNKPSVNLPSVSFESGNDWVRTQEQMCSSHRVGELGSPRPLSQADCSLSSQRFKVWL